MNNVSHLLTQPFESKPRLTFGVEIDFLLATAKAGTQNSHDEYTLSYDRDAHPEDPRSIHGLTDASRKNAAESVREHVAATLRKVGMEAEVGRNPKELGAWRINPAQALKAPNDQYAFFGIEIQSPPYYYGSSALQAVQAVCGILSNAYCLNVNDSCGMRVNVGNELRGFSVPTIRNLLATIWTLEKQLDEIHSIRQPAQLCSFRGHSKLAELVPGEDAAEKGLEILLQSTVMMQDTQSIEETGEYETAVRNHTLQDFIDLCRPGRGNLRGNYWIGSVASGSKTVEFRQHASTLNPKAMSSWIELCVGLLEFSDTVHKPVLDGFLRMHVGDDVGRLGLAAVLKALGLPKLMLFYWEAGENGSDSKIKGAVDVRDNGVETLSPD